MMMMMNCLVFIKKKKIKQQMQILSSALRGTLSCQDKYLTITVTVTVTATVTMTMTMTEGKGQ